MIAVTVNQLFILPEHRHVIPARPRQKGRRLAAEIDSVQHEHAPLRFHQRRALGAHESRVRLRAVAGRRSFTRAAEELGLTQAAISAQIAIPSRRPVRMCSSSPAWMTTRKRA